MEKLKRSFKEIPKYAIPGVFLGIGAYALLHKQWLVAAAGGILGFFTWPKKESGGAHMVSSSSDSRGHLRAVESSYSSGGRITLAEAPLKNEPVYLPAYKASQNHLLHL